MTPQVRIGAEYQIPVIDTHVRVGYFLDSIPFTYVLDDASAVDVRNFLTAGVGKIFEDSLKLDVAYMLGTWQQHIDELTIERLSHRVFVSAAYRF